MFVVSGCIVAVFLVYTCTVFCVIDVYCDGTDFETVKRRCKTQPLKKQHMTAHRVPVSSSILVENHSPSTDAEDLHNYFQTPRANAGAVLEVKPIENADKFKVVFASTKGNQNHRPIVIIAIIIIIVFTMRIRRTKMMVMEIL